MEHPTRRLDEAEAEGPDEELDSQPEPDPCPKCGNPRIWLSETTILRREFITPGINYMGLPITGDRHRSKIRGPHR